MAGKNTKSASGSGHTAGIFADMTVDGPEIGTLVVIVDRAKNLPNRKSMGKQNPYCAARLGKEAKKTETDKRGGQTPKWDQEMRFTVHESPDYYQLKVSVFNDDKKTELIGETWVALEQIVVPGGGQNDVWHTLNCKGRFAGEIRIELTYYDTRPREEKPEKRRQSAPLDAPTGQTVSGVVGPRQPKPVKRRPLPADPTDLSQSSPLSQTPPKAHQRYAESPDDYGFESTPQSASQQSRVQNGVPRESSSEFQQHGRHLQQSSMGIASSPQQPPPGHYHMMPPNDSSSSRQEEYDIHESFLQNEYHYEDPISFEDKHGDDWQSRRPLTQPLQNVQGMIHAHSSPAMVDARPHQNAPRPQPQYLGSSPPKSYSFHEGLEQRRSLRDTYDHQEQQYMAHVSDQASPPPPPAHRNSGSQPMPDFQNCGQQGQFAPVPATAPLNVRYGRGSIAGSPLSQVQSNPSHVDYQSSTSPSTSHSHPYTAPSVSSNTSYGQLRNQRSQSPIRDLENSVPPSLVPGYEPSIAEDETNRIMHEKRMSAHHQYSNPPRPLYQQATSPTHAPQPRPQQVSRPRNAPQPHYQQVATSMPPSMPQSRLHNAAHAQERRAYRQSAPMMQQQAMSPDPRTPVRKSVSPHPDSAPTERRHSEIPFSPDAFDAFNPALNAANSVNEPGARYNTPEQAKEASRQHERQEKLGDGPIIGNDGRIIDPSDHLPTDTWAPEPEQKMPKKGPQVTMRFRHSPQGAHPMPAQRRPPVEHSMSSPAYIDTRDRVSPNTAGRARLQKKTPGGMVQQASSPLVPTLDTAPRSSPLRSSESTYPLRERENYGGHDSSPGYGRPSSGNVPPPIPGKVPLGGGQEDWNTRALSEEMQRIDIGVGGGQRGPRRTRYGF
ncbi:hypothetical protein ACLMJK_000576 [Lecanora helva]